MNNVERKTQEQFREFKTNSVQGGSALKTVTSLVDEAGNAIDANNPLEVSIGSATLTVNLDAANDEVTVYGSSDGGTTRQVIHTDASGDLQIDLASAVPAGENFIGSVGGKTAFVSSTITMSVAGAYATGDYMGTTTTPQSFASAARVSAGSGVIKSLVISDKITTTNVAMELWLFRATFTAPTDNAAWAISDTEMLDVLAVVPISTSNWYASSNNQIYTDATLSIPFKLSSGTAIFYALVARGTTPSFTSGDITINLGILQD